MIYYNPFKQFVKNIFNFILSLFTKKFLFIIILVLIILLLHLNVHAATQTIDIAQLEADIQEERQNSFVLYAYNEFVNNTNAWNDDLKPFFDELLEKNFDIFCNAPMNNNNVINHKVYLYNAENNYTEETITAYNNYNSQSDTRKNRIYSNIWSYDFTYNKSTGVTNYLRTYPTTVTVPLSLRSYKSDLLNDFLLLINGYNTSGSADYTNTLNDISNYLSSIKDYNSYINYTLSNILSILNTIANKTETDYTQQISGITNQVTDINSSIQNQTQQQHQDAQATQNAINNQTQQQHQDAQATQNTIEESTNSILSTEADDISIDDFGVSTPQIEGSPDLTNVFNLLYDSFMSVYEDDIYRIQFGLPSGDTTYNFDIPANALRDKLPEPLIVLISVFWWVVLGGAVISFIVRIIHQIVTYSNGSVDQGGSGGGFLSELTMTPTEFVLFNILH